MRDSLDAFLRHLQQHEGGFVDHPRDPGGPTNMGITLVTYRRLIDPHATASALRQMDWATAARIYRETYWATVHGDELPAGVDLMVADMAVNAGPGTAIRLLLRVAPVDPRRGRQLLDRIRSRDATQLVGLYADARMHYYKGLKHWTDFGRGWTARVRGAQSAALALIAAQKKSPEAHP